MKYHGVLYLSDLLDGDVSHDKVTRFLNATDLSSKDLWQYIKPIIRKHQAEQGVLILDDSIEEKPYTDINDINCYHFSHAKGDIVKGINILSCLVRYNDISFHIG